VKILEIFLRGLAYIWMVGVLLLICIGVVGVWMETGFSGVLDMGNPFTIHGLINGISTIIALAPAMGLLALARMIRAKVTDRVK
jgi:hypothetical protein